MKRLFPPTVIRRTDFAVFANAGDLKDLSFINQKAGAACNSRVTPEMLRALIYWVWNLKPEQVDFRPEAEDVCLARAKEMTEVYGYAADIPLVTLSDFRKKLARIAAAIAAVMASASDDFSRLIVLPEHIEMAAEFPRRVYSHDNCALDDYSEIQRVGSQLLDYEEIEKAFLEKHENERHDPENGTNFPRAIFTLRVSDRVRREDLAEQVGCSVETVSRIVRLLKRFTLIETTPQGYMKKPKFNKFLRRFVRAHPEFFDGALPEGMSGSNRAKSLDNQGVTEE